IKDSIIYSTAYPCILCSKLLINAGIKRIIIEDSYPDEMSRKMLKEAGVIIEIPRKGVKKHLGKRGRKR
ncbi:MAG: deaminase, partial [candidate division Zixibacteria bacterium]|nr:deaminase [candidate division Zixibacteria bacterium]